MKGCAYKQPQGAKRPKETHTSTRTISGRTIFSPFLILAVTFRSSAIAVLKNKKETRQGLGRQWTKSQRVVYLRHRRHQVFLHGLDLPFQVRDGVHQLLVTYLAQSPRSRQKARYMRAPQHVYTPRNDARRVCFHDNTKQRPVSTFENEPRSAEVVSIGCKVQTL